MAASSGDDILAQLAALLGRESVCQIRKTDTVPPRISVIDVVEAITGQVKSNAGKTLERVKESHPEVYPNWINYRFPGRGQRDTPIAGKICSHWNKTLCPEPITWCPATKTQPVGPNLVPWAQNLVPSSPKPRTPGPTPRTPGARAETT